MKIKTTEIIRDKKGRIIKAIGQNTNKNGTAGRPTIMTQETILKLEHAYAMDCTDEEACSFADISRQTLYDYQNKNPEFVDRKQALKQKPFLIARNTLMQGIKENPELALKYMERKKKHEFSLRQEIEHDGKIEGVQIYLPAVKE